jgi:MFS family permease
MAGIGTFSRQTPLHRDYIWLLGLCLARSAFTTINMTYAATLPVLQADWAMSASQAGLIHSAFHVGYLISLFGVGFLADRYGAKRVFLVASLFAAASAFSFAVFAESFVTGLLLYGATALFSGGSYTPVLTIIAQRFDARRRGRAIGAYIAASSLGYAASLYISGAMLEWGGWRAAFYVTGAGPAVGVLLAFFTLRATSNVIPEPAREVAAQNLWRAVVTNKPAMLVIMGYTFHSWELLGMWAWLPAFLTASLTVGTGSTGEAVGFAASLSALLFVVSMGGNLVGGSLSDRLGRTAVMLLMGLGSIVCSFTIGWLVAAPLWIVVAVGVVYHFAGIGDSPVYSTAITEVVSPRYIGAAYSLRSVAGFGAGVISPALFGLVLDRFQGGATGTDPLAWGLAFGSLGLGGLLGPLGIAWLRRLPESTQMAGGRR